MIRSSPLLEQYGQQLSMDKNNAFDTWLCHLSSLRRLTEEASIVFELEDPASTVTLHDAKGQFQLAILEKRLKSWRDSAPRWIDEGKNIFFFCS
jgi:hypothetical protein